MKRFAFFLPQFHEINENNIWWGQGFTEWTNVKAAKPLFKGHLQPRIPMKGYYNLLDKETMLWQTDLAKDYGVDGFIYYHYYFSGKLIMEKPAENLLRWKDIDQKFFFCWANHSWVKGKGKDRKVLIEQTYGDKEDWENHIQYLLPFFKDRRYEKKNGKPLLMIYSPLIHDKVNMIRYFDEKCRQEGLEGISIVETYDGNLSKGSLRSFSETLCQQSDIVFYREPSVSTSVFYRRYPWLRVYRRILKEYNLRSLNGKAVRIKGNSLFRIMLKKEYPQLNGVQITRGLFFEWDNTPRHKYLGYVISPPAKQFFLQYMDKIRNDEYCFINAWNEWAEGMMLEPTTVDKYKYLEWIKESLTTNR